MAIQFTNDNFQKEAIEASKEKPVLIDFFASWCGPCKMQGPIIDEVAEEMGEKAVVGKLDTEKENVIAEKYGVMSIPNLILFKGGKKVENMVGLQNKEYLIDIINKYL